MLHVQRDKRERQHIQKKYSRKTIEFYPKAQVCKSKLQSCPEPSKVGDIMYSAHTIQVNDLIKIS